MKTIITVLFLLFAGLTNADAQNNWKPDATSKYNLTEIVIPYLTRTETYFGADVEYTDKGAMVVAVMPNSPAESHRFRKGDIITAIGDVIVLTKNGYVQAMETYKPEQIVKVSYFRKGVAKTKKVRLEKIQVFKQPGTM